VMCHDINPALGDRSRCPQSTVIGTRFLVIIRQVRRHRGLRALSCGAWLHTLDQLYLAVQLVRGGAHCSAVASRVFAGSDREKAELSTATVSCIR
jgi:hypothetical protein